MVCRSPLPTAVGKPAMVVVRVQGTPHCHDCPATLGVTALNLIYHRAVRQDLMETSTQLPSSSGGSTGALRCNQFFITRAAQDLVGNWEYLGSSVRFITCNPLRLCRPRAGAPRPEPDPPPTRSAANPSPFSFVLRAMVSLQCSAGTQRSDPKPITFRHTSRDSSASI
jgi:hypothetical protein